MARVLLVNPPIHDFAAFDLWAKPLGLLYLAAALERDGHEVRVIDCLDRFHPAIAGTTGKFAPKRRRYGTGTYYWSAAAKPDCYGDIPRIYKRFGLPGEVILEELRADEPPDVIGITSGMTYWYPGVVEAVNLARQVFPATPLALGGIYATLCPGHARAVAAPDLLVEGYGEAPFLSFVRGNSDKSGAANDTAFSRLPNPAYHLLRRFEYVAVLTGRGCPYRCAYCASGILAPRMERREPGSVVEEIGACRRRFGVTDVAFYDDALLWDPEEHIKPILRSLAAENLGLHFHTPNGLHARMIDAELARLMQAAGFKTIRLSLESVRQERLEDWDNKVTFEDLLRAVWNLRQAGFEAGQMGAYVMTGLPGETVEEAVRSTAAVHAAGIPVRLAHYSPIPGTRYFELAKKEARFDISEPLLQNNTVVPAGAIGSYSEYAVLKDFANRLNEALAGNRTVFTGAQVEKEDPRKLLEAVMKA